MKKTLSIMIILLFISSSIPIVVSNTPTVNLDNPWAMISHDAQNSGLSQYNTNENTGVEIWRFICDGWIQGGSVIDNDGTIYFGSNDDYLYALNNDGTLKWKFKTSGTIVGTPAIDDNGIVYVGNLDETFYAVNPDGTLLWYMNTDDIWSSPIINNEGVVIITTMHDPQSQDSQIYAINPNGTIKWEYFCGANIYGNVGIDNQNNVYCGSLSGTIFAFYPNGTVKWIFETHNIIRGSPLIDGDRLYIESGGDLYSIDTDNSSVIWTLRTGMSHMSPSVDKDGYIYFGGGYKFFSIYPNGTIRWFHDFLSENASEFWRSCPAISNDGTIYIGVSNHYTNSIGGEILAFSNDGAIKWRKKISVLGIQSSPSIGSDGTIYIGSHSKDYGPNDIGSLHAFKNGIPNNPPETPTIQGPTRGEVDVPYEYSLYSTDPDGEDISYYVHWGDGGNDADWYGSYPSGEIVKINLTWEREHDFVIRVKARDEFGEDSDYATLEVAIPKSHLMDLLLDWISERFPIIYSILNFLN